MPNLPPNKRHFHKHFSLIRIFKLFKSCDVRSIRHVIKILQYIRTLINWKWIRQKTCSFAGHFFVFFFALSNSRHLLDVSFFIPIIKLFSFSDMNPSAKKFFFFLLLFLLRTCFNMSFRSDHFLFSF